MTTAADPNLEERILVLAPVGKDGRLVADALAKVGVRATPCVNASALNREVKAGAGALFLTEEAFDEPANVLALFSVIDRQPSWSDLPVIVCFGKRSQLTKTLAQTLALLDAKGNLTLLERPMNPRLLVNAARSALRSRRRQYERRRADEERQSLIGELSHAKERAEAASCEIKAVLAREREARQTAEDANRAKDMFLATLSHELRTPLNAILGFSQILPHEAPGTAEFAMALATIVRNAKAQRDLIEDILDVSRIISGKLGLDKKPVNLVRLVGDTLESFKLATREKGQTIRLTSDAISTVSDGDPKRLQQVFSNLLSNAVKFTPEGGLITVVMTETANSFDVVIADSGEGIEPEFLPFVFDRFRQQDGSFTRRFGGLGLGLSIVRHLVDAHGGTIVAESGGRGKGAAFKISLPLSRGSPAADPEASSTPGLAPSPSPALSIEKLSGRVLVVDDQFDSRTLVRVVLQRAGMEVVEVASAALAREALRSTVFDALVCDIGMPDEDGIAFIHWLRASESAELSTLPAAALSGFASEDDKNRALGAGFDLHLSKPVYPGEVIGAVTKLLQPSDRRVVKGIKDAHFNLH